MAAKSSDPVDFGRIKIEPTPESEPIVAPAEPMPANNNVSTSIDPKDPESFLKRCSGTNKKTKLRCSSVIGQKAQQDCHPTFLPTCRAHRDQQSYAGWCKHQNPGRELCNRLFKWTPPYFELCPEHEGHPDTPCYFMELPLELRHEIYRYLLPSQPIGSSTASIHDGNDNTIRTSCNMFSEYGRSRSPNSVFPMPALDLFLLNRQIYLEIKDLLFGVVQFTIDVRKDGTFMCGRRLLEPRRADGSSHFVVDESDESKQRFLKYFDWSSVKHYAVNILVENWADQMQTLYPHNSAWDEEVEIYDIRDYISVVVSGVLAKSRSLCKLQIRVCLADFNWPHEQVLANTKIIVGPFERLRNVRQPQILGVWLGRPYHNLMINIQRPPQLTGSLAAVCSVPPLPSHNILIASGMPDFDAYATIWRQRISSKSHLSMISKPPIRTMFTEFKDFYAKLSLIVPDVTRRGGRYAFLHRARVAREQEDIESFRAIRNELIYIWNHYLDTEERKKKDMNARLGRMLDADIYPSHEWYMDPPAQSSATTKLMANEEYRRNSPSTSTFSTSPSLLNPARLAEEGIPMAGNQHRTPCLERGQPCAIRKDYNITTRGDLQLFSRGLRKHSIHCQKVQHRAVTLYLDRALQQGRSLAVKRIMDDVPEFARLGSHLDVGNDMFALCGHAGPLGTGHLEHYAGLQSDWFEESSEAGPSTKHRRIDSGFGEMVTQDNQGAGVVVQNEHEGQVFTYVGKGKGRAEAVMT